MAKVVFEEKQRFDQWWIITLFAFVLIIMIRMLIRVLDADPEDENAFWSVFSGFLIMLVVSIFFFSLRLISRIDESGIHAKFNPFNMAKKFFQWKEIQKVEVVDYSPLRHYGGWGYRISSKRGTAMNMRGSKGIRIFLQNGKQFLIGTQRPDEAQQALNAFVDGNKN